MWSQLDVHRYALSGYSLFPAGSFRLLFLLRGDKHRSASLI